MANSRRSLQMFIFLPLMAALCAGGPLPEAPSFFPEAPEEPERPGHAAIEVRTDVGWVGPSQTFHVVVAITPDSRWHVYWKNPGASGGPTEFELRVPEGFTVGEPQFPRPSIFRSDEGNTYGYGETAAIFIPVTAPEILRDGTVEIEVTTLWLACNENCVMGEQTKTIEVSTNATMKGPMHKDLQLSKWEEALPKPLDGLAGGTVTAIGSTIYISGESQLRPIRFIGIDQKGLHFEPNSEMIIDGDSFRLPVPVKPDFAAAGGDTIVVEGLLLFGRKNTDPSYVVRVEVNSTTNYHNGEGN